MWTEVPELAAFLRDGQTSWEQLNLDDVDIRMKFAGMFHRSKRTPRRFMMRLKVSSCRRQLGAYGWCRLAEIGLNRFGCWEGW
jgi:sulfite reductase beta subunit-like hemoprotein